MCAELICNGTVICTKTVLSKLACSCSGTWSRCVACNDCIDVLTYAEAQTGGQTKATVSRVTLTSIGAGVGSYCISTPSSVCSITCGGPYLPE